MGFPLHPSESREEMTSSKGLKKEKGTSPRREKQKSYLGPRADERQLSNARKSAIKESLGAILSEDSGPPSRTRPRPEDDTITSPRRSKSGGYVLPAVAGQAFAQPRRSISSSYKSSGLYDDPFIDALLGAQSSVTTSSVTQQNPRKMWHGLGLDQFKEKMGYKKPFSGDESGHYSLDASDTGASFESGTGGPNRKLEQKRSRSPSFLRQRAQATSHSERGTRSIDKAFRRLSLSSHHTRTTVGEESAPTSYSEHRRSINVQVRRAPNRTRSDEQPSRLRWRQDDEESSDLPPPPLGGAMPGRHIRRTRKKAVKQDSFYGLELEKEGQSTQMSPKTNSPSTSSHRTTRSKPKVLLSKVSSSSPRSPRSSHSRERPSTTTKRVTSSLRTPSTRERKSLSASTSPTATTPSTISSRPREIIESTEGWADLQLDALDPTEMPVPVLDERYGNDIKTAMVVGENLMNLGVQLLTRGHDLKTAATRRNSLLGRDSQRSTKVETHIPIESDMEHITLGTKYPPKHWDRLEKLEQKKEMAAATSNDYADDFMDDESEIESLAGILDESRRRYDHQSSDLEAKHGTSINSLSSHGASFASLMDGASSSNGTSFNSIMDGSMDDVDDLDDEDLMFSDLHDAAYATHTTTTTTTTTTNTTDAMDNSELFGDSWCGLELEFSELTGPTTSLPAHAHKSKRSISRHRSAPLEPVKKYYIPKGNKPSLGRPPSGKSKLGTLSSNKDPGMDKYSTSY